MSFKKISKYHILYIFCSRPKKLAFKTARTVLGIGGGVHKKKIMKYYTQAFKTKRNTHTYINQSFPLYCVLSSIIYVFGTIDCDYSIENRKQRKQ